MNAALNRIAVLVERISIRLPLRAQRPSFGSTGGVRVARGPHRSGISLIEVLIAVFVLTFGLMSVAMVIPAGRYMMVEAAKSDRGSACGRAALNDMKIRGWLLPGQNDVDWVTRDAGGGLNSVFRNGLHISYGDAFAIDPLFYAIDANKGNAVMRHFPYRNPGVTQAAPEMVLMTRITVANGGTILPFEVADRICTWRDDLIFSTLSDEDRPRLSVKWPNGDVSVFQEPDPKPLRASYEGKFSWLATVVPVLGYTGDILLDPNQDQEIDEVRQTIRGITQYEISIVVLYARDLYCPTRDDLNLDTATPKERSVYARMDGSGIGGGDVYLMSNKRDWLELRKNNWIMLKGREIASQIGNFQVHRKVFKWYRVVNVADIEASVTLPNGSADGFGRFVTLAGPDWQVDTQPPPGAFDPAVDIAEAAIIDDVVGVYTTIVDVNSL